MDRGSKNDAEYEVITVVRRSVNNTFPGPIRANKKYNPGEFRKTAVTRAGLKGRG